MVAIATEEEPWTLYFDGSSTSNSGGAGVVLINPEGQATTLLFKLTFPCPNNVAKYEAFVMGLSTAKEMGIEKIKVIGDSNLVLSQLQGSFAVKEATLAPYCTAAERLVNSFKQVVLEHIPGVTNRYADALATLGSKLSFVEEQPNITVIKREMQAVTGPDPDSTPKPEPDPAGLPTSTQCEANKLNKFPLPETKVKRGQDFCRKSGRVSPETRTIPKFQPVRKQHNRIIPTASMQYTYTIGLRP